MTACNHKESVSGVGFGLGLASGVVAGCVIALVAFVMTLPSDLVSSNTFLASLSGVAGWLVQNWGHALLGIAAPAALCAFYCVFLRPLEYSRDLPEVVKQIQGNKNFADYPAPYPNSWYKLLDSSELKVGEVRHIEAFGQDLAVFRTRGDAQGKGRGQVSIIDAICPHLGANMALGGKVVGNCLQCPFHGWQFNTEGKCTKIPYSTRPPPEVARTNAWHLREMNQSIFVWFDVDRKPPAWEIPDMMPGSGWTRHGKVQHFVTCHMQEIPENGADNAHLEYLHGDFIIPGLSFIKHHWAANWQPRASESHIADMVLDTSLQMCGRNLPLTHVNVQISQCGPAFVFLHFHTAFGQLIVIESLLPVAPNLQRTHNAIYAERLVPRVFAKLILKSLAIQFERDIPIWQHKKLLRKPMVVQGDGPILKYRRWMKQFYSEEGTKVQLNEEW